MGKTSCVVAYQQPSRYKEAKASKRVRDIRLSDSTGYGQRGGLMQECFHDKLLLTFCHSQASLGALDINSFHIPNTGWLIQQVRALPPVWARDVTR